MGRYRFIAAERGHYPVRQRCQVGMPTRGYYAWQAGQQPAGTPVTPAGTPVTPAWESVLVKAFRYHQRRYGTRRLQVVLRQNGHRVGRQRLRGAMRRRGLHALQPKAFTPRTTDSTHGLRCAPNRFTRKAAPFWEYVPFNYEFPARRTAFLDMLAELKIEVSLLSSLEKVIARKKDLSKAYRSLDGDLNENSLVVYSGALGPDLELSHKSQTCRRWHLYYYSHKEGCLYLGDTDLTLPAIVDD